MITPLHPSETIRTAAQQHRDFRDNTVQQLAQTAAMIAELKERVAALEQKQADDVQTLANDLTDIYEQQLKKADLDDVRAIVRVLNERTVEIETVLSTIEPEPAKLEAPTIQVRTAESTSRRTVSPGLPLRGVKARVVEKTL